MSEPYEFPVGEHTYRAKRLSAEMQFHVSRRLAPLLVGAANAKGEGLIGRLGGAAEALAALPDADADFVLKACTSNVQRKLDNDRGWAPIRSEGGFMFDDIDMVAMLQIVWKVLEANLANFTRALPLNLGELATALTSNP